MHMDPNTLDSNNEHAAYELIGRKFKHGKRQKVYEVIGIAWMGENDVWGVLHTAHKDPVFVRSQRNFLGAFPNGKKRFEEVQ